MPNKLDWLEVELREAYDIAVKIHNEPSRQRYQSWLYAISEIRRTMRAVDEGESAPLQAESTPEVLSIEEVDTTSALRN